MSLVSLRGFSKLKTRPKTYKARDAAYSVGGNRGFYIASLPRPYPKTKQQLVIGETARDCNIKKGMKKADLMLAMTDCIKPKLAGKKIP